MGTAREFGIDQHEIQSGSRGFHISQRLDDVLYDERSNTTDTSGNRAVKNDSQKGN